jgi:hypothetical protein
MMKVSNLLIIFISAMTIASCSGGFGTMDRVMSSWQGASLDEAIMQWGPPQQEQTIAGRKYYRWFYTKSAPMPMNTYGTANQFGNTTFVQMQTTGGGMMVGSCTRTLSVDDKNIIVGTHWEGNNCPFADVLEYSNWERKKH